MTAFSNTALSGVPDIDGERFITSATKVLANGDTVFTVVGDIIITNLVAECLTANDATATTLQWNAVPTIGTPTTISGASTSLASLTAGATITLDGSSLAAAPIIATSGASLAQTARGIQIPEGTIKLIIAVGSTTGTWRHYLRYKPLESGAYVY